MYYKLKHPFQYEDSNHKIFTFKEGTEISDKEGDFYIIYQNKKKYQIPKEIVENNPEYFERYDLKAQLEKVLKQNKKRTYKKLSECLEDFLHNDYLSDKEIVSEDIAHTMLEACRQKYIETENEAWLYPIQELGYNVDENGVHKND